ncbi:hypothetical protein CHS0354_010684 [Potamilus streckersoni]|uniref:Cadherin domain-containing protein n=1 Tax=Potamilus streckersoni TaxID=2493646 RepID=A0AAE0WB22_9BIVA|nr:hypothetical protein CHS0354_010684 [Potamilus streckersoni]
MGIRTLQLNIFSKLKMESWTFHILLMIIISIFTNLSKGQDYQVTFQVEEELPSGTFVGNVSSASKFLDDVQASFPEDYGNLRYSFLTKSSVQSIFSLNDKTGFLFTSVVIDSDTIPTCRVSTDCEFIFDIAAQSARAQSSFFEIITIKVAIIDKNDNAPTFARDTITLTVPESSANGSSFPIESAVDKDSRADNSIKNYEIISPDNIFRLDVDQKLDGSFAVKIVVNTELDRETNDFYQVTVIAKDGGKPPRTGAMKINITITDINDNPPVFEKDSYNISVMEDVLIGTSILQVKATDKDIGPNGEITYQLSPHQMELSTIKEKFAINEKTGVLSVIGQLLYEEGKTYKLIVEALDKGERPLLSLNQAVINIVVNDTGNNPPIVMINLVSSAGGHVVNVSELATINQFVAHIQVEDTDTGENGEVACEVSNPKFGLQSLSGKGYKVVVRDSLDRETFEMHNVVVTCHDYGNPFLSSSASFLVRVTDENDNPPVFSQSIYLEGIDEENRIDEIIGRVYATDKDTGQNGLVQYYVAEEFKSMFQMNPQTGILTANARFDREVTSNITFKVLAIDQGTPSQLTGMSTVVITLNDINDNPPRFTKELFEFSIMENNLPDTLVGQLTAKDIDEGRNAQFAFNLANKTSSFFPFVVFWDGRVKCNSALDREVKSEYFFTAVATDQGTPSRSSFTNIHVKVLDENDMEPHITFPVQGNNTISVPHLLSIRTVIATIEAHDDDDGINQELTYLISSGNENGIFYLNPSNGELSMTMVYPVEKDELFTLFILVHDNGIEKQHSVKTELNIIIKYSNASALAPFQDYIKGSYVGIVVAVITVTTLLSTAIIVVICVIRRFDQHQQKHQQIEMEGCQQNNMVDLIEDKTNGLPILSQSYDKADLPKKKKEVSFSFDDEMDSNDHELSFSTTSAFEDQKQKESQYHHGDVCPNRQIVPLKSFGSHQSLQTPITTWNPKTHELKTSLALPSEDCHSDTSRETVTSDSGRGGSDDDLPISSCKDHLKGPIKKLEDFIPKSYRRGISPKKVHSLSLEDRTFNNSGDKSDNKNNNNSCRQSYPVAISSNHGNKKSTFKVWQPLTDRKVCDKAASPEIWSPSFV